MWRDWEQAWDEALYGVDGFVRAGDLPAQHFRTSVHVGGVLAEAVLELLDRVDTRLGHPEHLDLVDLGAGGGELLVGVVDAAPRGLRTRLRPVAVDLRPAPSGWSLQGTVLPWVVVLPERVTGLVVAHEWLDALPCPVVQHDGTAPDGRVMVRRVQVSERGAERLGPAAAGADRAWLRRWGPPRPGDRTEVGLGRDRAWAAVVRRVVAGAALAVDYGLDAPGDTLAAYRGGRQVRPVPDGSCDLTAHVHWPSVAAVAPSELLTQAQALAALAALGTAAAGDGTGDGTGDGWAWLRSTARNGHLAELTDPAGLGAHGWLLVPCGVGPGLLRAG